MFVCFSFRIFNNKLNFPYYSIILNADPNANKYQYVITKVCRTILVVRMSYHERYSYDFYLFFTFNNFAI
jgi:hypothetical protein